MFKCLVRWCNRVLLVSWIVALLLNSWNNSNIFNNEKDWAILRRRRRSKSAVFYKETKESQMYALIRSETKRKENARKAIQEVRRENKSLTPAGEWNSSANVQKMAAHCEKSANPKENEKRISVRKSVLKWEKFQYENQYGLSTDYPRKCQ